MLASTALPRGLAGHMMEATIAERIAEVKRRIANAAERTGRNADDVCLVAVSKTKPIEAIVEAHRAGQRDFGENRLEELWEKVALARRHGLEDIRWHMIGSIQSRKTPLTIGPFVLVHSVDRVKIANRMNRDAAEADKTMDILLEVNVSGEESKHGFSPASIVQDIGAIVELPRINIQGLMTMAPIADDPEEVRPIFRTLRELYNELAAEFPQADWRHISMGMTQDYEVAVEEGATIVRVGSAIFGARHDG